MCVCVCVMHNAIEYYNRIVTKVTTEVPGVRNIFRSLVAGFGSSPIDNLRLL